MNDRPKIWYNFFKEPYNSDDPYFFDESYVSDWVNIIESNFEIIKQEMASLLEERELKLKPYRFHQSKTGKPEWLTLSFITWGAKYHSHCAKCPETIRILEKIPGLVSASLSCLEANSDVPVHRGDTNAIVRSHLGISIPGTLPDCGFQCGDEKRQWQEGKVLPFCDAQPHTAWNYTGTARYVMIIDVMRPEFISLKNEVCATILATHILHTVDKYVKFYKNAGTQMLKYITYPIRMVLQTALPAQRKLKLLF